MNETKEIYVIIEESDTWSPQLWSSSAYTRTYAENEVKRLNALYPPYRYYVATVQW